MIETSADKGVVCSRMFATFVRGTQSLRIMIFYDSRILTERGRKTSAYQTPVVYIKPAFFFSLSFDPFPSVFFWLFFFVPILFSPF